MELTFTKDTGKDDPVQILTSNLSKLCIRNFELRPA